MVKGSESVIVSYTCWESVPNPTEKARLAHIGALLLSHDIKMYADVLDPTLDNDHFCDEDRLLENSGYHMSENGLWLAIIANRRQQPLLRAQARQARAHNMSLVLAYQDETEGSLPALETMALDNGAIHFWENDRDLRDIVREEVVPMCHNTTNDCNTKWTSQRKTA